MPANTKKTEKSGRIETLRQPVEKIWLAGLGALALTEEEGTRLFKSLVKRGQAFDKDTRHMLDKAVENTRTAPGEAINRIEEGVTDTLGGVLRRLGVPTRKEINSLTRRVETLATTLEKRPARPRRTTRKPATRKPATRRAKVTVTETTTAS